jgi:RHH-type proline utilization regulon transcriptional repressor/proline dehydrogenase/delta 1-pyrroline-5-carboxylate dehydrogenase
MNEQMLQDNWRAIHENYLADEKQSLKKILSVIGHYDADAIRRRAWDLVTKIREQKHTQSLVEAFLHEYQLNSEEGIVLLGIAEALLRIPDSQTQDLFLQEKLTEADWDKHLQHSDSLRVNLSTQALLISSRLENMFNTGADHRDIFDRVVT